MLGDGHGDVYSLVTAAQQFTAAQQLFSCELGSTSNGCSGRKAQQQQQQQQHFLAWQFFLERRRTPLFLQFTLQAMYWAQQTPFAHQLPERAPVKQRTLRSSHLF
jgi:hypothetical protein